MSSALLPFHKQFPDKFRSQTTFGQYEKIYRRPASIKNKKSKEFKQKCEEERRKLSKVIDFDNIANNTKYHRNNIQLLSSNSQKAMYGYRSFPGLFILPKYLSTQQQFEWTQRAICDFSNAPYNNLSNLKDCNVTTWKEAVQHNDYKQFRRLTWCNVGIKYDWTQREYDLNTITAPIPMSMINLCNECNQLLTDKLRYFDNDCDERHSFSKQIIPQTSIINFFEVNTKRPMGGHRDAAELTNAPLVSVSLGNDAIFLISKDDDTEPLALWLRSGSVLMMSGSARFALHSVARVVPNSCSSEFMKLFDEKIKHAKDESERKELKLMKSYVCESRINFNIRQVLENEHETNVDFESMHSF